MKIRNIILLGILLMSSVSIFAQDVDNMSRKERRAYEREKAKADKAELDKKKIAITQICVDSASFVIEADMIFDKRGNGVNVSSDINFIGISKGEATMQLGSLSRMGYNGVGGITIDGNVSNYKVTKNEKHGSYSIRFVVTSNTGIYDVYISVNSNGETADATISGLRPYSIRYNGELVPVQTSRVYKGSTLY